MNDFFDAVRRFLLDYLPKQRWKNYSFVFVFAAIFLFYVFVSTGLTWGGVTNILRHSYSASAASSQVWALSCGSP